MENTIAFIDQTIADIVRHDHRAVHVFRRHRIDFCCGGKRTLQDVCNAHRLEVDSIVTELIQETASEPTSLIPDYENLSSAQLAEYIVENHHGYIRQTLPDLIALSKKLANVHGPRHPELLTLHQQILEMAENLLQHLQKEELVLFPRFIEVENLRHAGQPTQQVERVIQTIIQVMEAEHADEGRRLALFRELTNDYQIPTEACNTWRVVWKMLHAFESDLHIHIHLENNILFTR